MQGKEGTTPRNGTGPLRIQSRTPTGDEFRKSKKKPIPSFTVIESNQNPSVANLESDRKNTKGTTRQQQHREPDQRIVKKYSENPGNGRGVIEVVEVSGIKSTSKIPRKSSLAVI